MLICGTSADDLTDVILDPAFLEEAEWTSNDRTEAEESLVLTSASLLNLALFWKPFKHPKNQLACKGKTQAIIMAGTVEPVGATVVEDDRAENPPQS